MKKLVLSLLLGLLAGGAACGDSETPEVAAPVVDAGPECEPGTLACICIPGGSGCKDELLCIAGRCQLTEAPGEDEPGRPTRPPLQPPDSSSDEPDASVPPDPADASVPPDAGSAAPGLDAGTGDAG